MKKIWLVLGLLSASCSGKAAVGGACSKSADCEAGNACVAGKCGSCATNKECGADLVCGASKCVAATGKPLTITSVEGDSLAVDSATGKKRVKQNFVISGQNFDSGISSIKLLTANKVYDLVVGQIVGTAEASTVTATVSAALVADIPSTGLAGQLLVTSSDATRGTDGAEVSVLRGESGLSVDTTACAATNGIVWSGTAFSCNADVRFTEAGGIQVPDGEVSARSLSSQSFVFSGVQTITKTGSSAQDFTVEANIVRLKGSGTNATIRLPSGLAGAEITIIVSGSAGGASVAANAPSAILTSGFVTGIGDGESQKFIALSATEWYALPKQ